MSKSSARNSRINSSKELRVLGIDDSPFEFQDDSALLVGVAYRNGYVDGVVSTSVRVDGTDATERIAEMVSKSRYSVNVLLLQGMTVAGFNIIDMKKLNRLLKIPVLSVSRKHPDFGKIEKAMKKLPSFKERHAKMKNAPEVRKAKNIYYQAVGIEKKDIDAVLGMTTIKGNIPEPIRLAHLIAGGIVRGESKRRV